MGFLTKLGNIFSVQLKNNMHTKTIEILNQLRIKNNHQGLTESDWDSAKAEVLQLFINYKK